MALKPTISALFLIACATILIGGETRLQFIAKRKTRNYFGKIIRCKNSSL
jgi:hypothetical protein